MERFIGGLGISAVFPLFNKHWRHCLSAAVLHTSVLLMGTTLIFLLDQNQELTDYDWSGTRFLVVRGPGGRGGYFGLRPYENVPTFRVDFLTQNILDRVQI